MTKVLAALAAAVLALAALPAAAECVGKPHDQTATTTPSDPVVIAPEQSV